MSYELLEALDAAWRAVRPRLLNDTDELIARLRRRQLKGLMRPPRAWCLAVRANDRRISANRFLMCPENPIVHPSPPLLPLSPSPTPPLARPHGAPIYRPHQVTLESANLSWLCRPVAICFPGMDAREVAELLGHHVTSILRAARRGVFLLEWRHEPRRGRHARIYHEGYLDPAGIPIGRMEDIEWGTHWRFVSQHLPANLSQTLTRIPTFRDNAAASQWADDPDTPNDFDTPDDNITPLSPSPLPPISPSTDHDFHVQDYHSRLAYLAELAAQENRTPSPLPLIPPSPLRSYPNFKGWRWLCPGCKRLVTRLFYPVTGLLRARFTLEDPVLKEAARIEDTIGVTHEHLPCFACHKCHDVFNIARLGRREWNLLISSLTAGLLYGREVTPPPWYTPKRRRKPGRKSTRPPGQRRLQVEQLLTRTPHLSLRAIALRLNMKLSTLKSWLSQIYRRYGVHSREELRQRLAAGTLR